MLDLAITDGTCVLPTGTQAADIGVKDGRIALVGAPGSLPAMVWSERRYGHSPRGRGNRNGVSGGRACGRRPPAATART